MSRIDLRHVARSPAAARKWLGLGQVNDLAEFEQFPGSSSVGIGLCRADAVIAITAAATANADFARCHFERSPLLAGVLAKHDRSSDADFTVTIRGICATQSAYSGAATTMSRRVKRPLPPDGRSPEGRAPLSGLGSRAAAVASAGRQAAARFPAAARRRSRLCLSRRRSRRAAAAADQGSDRRRDRGRKQHARRPLSRGALSRPVVLPHPAHRPQRRAARQRQARRQQGPDRGGAERPHSAAQARYAEGRGPALGSRDQDAAGAQGHDPVSRTPTSWC